VNVIRSLDFLLGARLKKRDAKPRNLDRDYLNCNRDKLM